MSIGGIKAVRGALSPFLYLSGCWICLDCYLRVWFTFCQETTSDAIGLLLLKHDWVGAVTRLLGPDPAETNENSRQARALVTVGEELEMATVIKMLELFP